MAYEFDCIGSDGELMQFKVHGYDTLMEKLQAIKRRSSPDSAESLVVDLKVDSNHFF